MAEEGLNRFEIHPFFEPVGGNGVADGVGRDVSNKASFDEVFFHAACHRTGRNALAKLIEKDRLRVGLLLVQLHI